MGGASKSGRGPIWGGSERQEKGERAPSFYSSQKRELESSKVPDIVNTEKHIQNRREQLGLINKIKFDQLTRKEIRNQLGNIFINMLEAQRQQILYKLGLELDDAKKKAFAQYMRESGKVEKEIATLSQEFESQLIDFGLDFGSEIWNQKKTRIEKLKVQLDQEKISEADYEREVENVERWMGIQRDNLDAKIEMILRNHAIQIERTLTLFKERRAGTEL